MRVSVVIPARNAAETIGEALDSLRAQTHGDWEAIVVDDGSTDGTADVVREMAGRDHRIRVVSGPASGVADARNAGLREARSGHLLFLDADDWIHPSFLAKMTAPLSRDVTLDGAYCGYRRCTSDGRVIREITWGRPFELFAGFARSCLWSIHSCVISKRAIEEVGGFPSGWKTCEDWDLWLRVVRAGARFAHVPESLASYRMRPDSASLDADEMARGIVRVIGIGHTADPRVSRPKPEYAAGLPAEDAPAARLLGIAWAGGLALGRGDEGAELLRHVAEDRSPTLDPGAVAEVLFEAMLLPRALGPESWATLLPLHEERIARFLQRLEEISGAPQFARRARRRLEWLIVDSVPLDADGTLGSLPTMAIDVQRPIPRIRLAPAAERIYLRIVARGRLLGSIALPVCDGAVPSIVVADAIARRFLWRLVADDLATGRRPGARQIRVRLAGLLRGVAARAATWFDERRNDFETWAYLSLDRYALLDELLPCARGGKRDARRLTGGTAVIDLGAALPSFRHVDRPLRVEVVCGGWPFGAVDVVPRRGRVSSRALRHALLETFGDELFVSSVREALVGHASTGEATVGQRLVAPRTGEGPADERSIRDRYDLDERPAVLLGWPPGGLVGVSVGRAALPSASVEEVRAATARTGRPFRTIGEDDAPPARVLVAPDAFPATPPVAAGDPGAVIPAGDPPAPRSTLGRGFDLGSRLVERAVPRLRRRLGAWAIADRLPVLMFHRIADSGSKTLSNYRLTPARFENHLRILRERGYRSIDLAEWVLARERRRQLRGRPVVLTFDDGYADFADTAAPLLARYGFRAIVFLVTDQVGRWADWDREHGGVEAPLMSWDQIRWLQGDGIEFGSHSVTHAALTSLPPAEIVRELVGSREAMARQLGVTPRALAYPFGDHDPVVRHLAGACGYRFGFTAGADVVRYPDGLLDLPRIEVHPLLDPEHLVGRIERRHRDPVRV